MSEVVTYSRFWMRRGTALEWSTANPVLHAGEIGIEQDPAASPGESRMKIGDGIRAWNLLDYFADFSPSGITDADYGDITVSGVGTVWTIDPAAVTLAKMANVATATVFYRKSGGTGVPEVQTLATLKTDLGLTGTNSGDQTITLTGDVTGTGTGSFATTLATAQPAVHTWALAQTFTVAPVFTDQAGTRSALGIDSVLSAIAASPIYFA